MTSTTPLTGSELIDSARANSQKGVDTAAFRCGYGDDVTAFETALQQAGAHIGVEIRSFEDLLKPANDRQEVGVEVAPEF